MKTGQHPQTGPVTTKGKAQSAKNAMKHGLGSRSILLPGESELDYAKHRMKVLASYPVNTPAQEPIVETIVQLQWFQQRNVRLLNNIMVFEQSKPITELEIEREIGGVKVGGKSLFNIMNMSSVYVKDNNVLKYEQCEKVLLGIQSWRLFQAGEDINLEEIYAYLSQDQRTIMQTINSNDFISIDRELSQFEKDALIYIENNQTCGWILGAIEKIQATRVMNVLTDQGYQRHKIHQERSLEKAYKYYSDLETRYINQLPDVSPKNYSTVDAHDVISR